MKNTAVKFRCPKCGSSHFGYSMDTGCCHGDSYCGFSWPRRDEWKHFVLVQEFESPEEFEDTPL